MISLNLMSSNLFAHLSDWAGEHVRVGVGDDCALLDVGPDLLVVSTDTLWKAFTFQTGIEVSRRAVVRLQPVISHMGAEPGGRGRADGRGPDSEWLESFLSAWGIA